MKSRLLAVSLVTVLTITLLGTSPLALVASTTDVIKSVDSLAMFQATKFNAHYRAPNTDQIETLLEEAGIPLNNPGAKLGAMQRFQQEWAKRNPTTPNPKKLEKLLDNERRGDLQAMAEVAAETPQIMSLAVPVEFPNSDTFNWCGSEVTTDGPLHNQI